MPDAMPEDSPTISDTAPAGGARLLPQPTTCKADGYLVIRYLLDFQSHFGPIFTNHYLLLGDNYELRGRFSGAHSYH